MGTINTYIAHRTPHFERGERYRGYIVRVMISAFGAGPRDDVTKPQSGFFTVHELNQSKVYFRVQRAVFCLCLYIALGIGYYHGQEGLSVTDSIYFTVVTLATVG